MWANTALHCSLVIALIFFDENTSSYNFTKWNSIIQAVLFFATANIPAYFFNRMDFVDIAWPWGLVVIGATGMVQSEGPSGRVIATSYLQNEF